ncbi:MAG: hypothetical protein QHD01_31730 [Bradyrhizobium sp.]|uniref:hypothetical protein n=1 Tax=Bradyrhizobium sp. TaxID=376 RepID=UPI0029AECA85|nr:hypothetical protein [Bradyrhizobium sp.]MDX3971140.1 hypothetical protein [Bradyrhizobium sp.]
MRSPLQLRALSVRQPWAWAIIHAGKDIENRGHVAIWKGGMKPGRRIAIHASKGMTRDEYVGAYDFMRSIGVVCPPAGALIRGAVIGTVEVIDIVTRSSSPWFFGPRGLVLRDPEPCEPIAASGQLGFFVWSAGGAIEQPMKWMLPKAGEAHAPDAAAASDDLFGCSEGK